MARSKELTDKIIETNAAMMDAAVTAYVSKNVSYELVRAVKRALDALDGADDEIQKALEPMVHGFRPLRPRKKFGVYAEARPDMHDVAAAPASADPLNIRDEGDDGDTPYYDSVQEVRSAIDAVILEMETKPHDDKDGQKKDGDEGDQGDDDGDGDGDDGGKPKKKQSAKDRRATMRAKKKQRAQVQQVEIIDLAWESWGGDRLAIVFRDRPIAGAHATQQALSTEVALYSSMLTMS